MRRRQRFNRESLKGISEPSRSGFLIQGHQTGEYRYVEIVIAGHLSDSEGYCAPMRHLLDLKDGGSIVECRDANQVRAFSSLWQSALDLCDLRFQKQIAEKIRAIADASRRALDLSYPSR